ncbi:hypothetical protein STAS_34673, partial [Striga asiatica]
MAITHADLAPRPKGGYLGSKTGAFVMVLTVVLGLFYFYLCLLADATRSEVNWMATNEGKGIESECTYTGSGRSPLLSASAAFLCLAIAMMVHHMYLLVAVSKSDALVDATSDPDSSFASSLACQAGFFSCLHEILMLIGLSIESGHLTNWATPRPSCLANKPGLFTAGGVSGLVTVFLASGLYITALRREKIGDARYCILEASATYATPPGTPAGVNPLTRQEYRNNNLDGLRYYLT